MSATMPTPVFLEPASEDIKLITLSIALFGSVTHVHDLLATVLSQRSYFSLTELRTREL